MSSSRIRLDKLDPNNPLALKIKEALDASDSKAVITLGRQCGKTDLVTHEVKKLLQRTYDSQEEHEFSSWCEEAQSLGLIYSAVYHPPAFQLSPKVTYKRLVKMKTKVKEADAFLFHPHEYTIDFILNLTEKGIEFLKSRKLMLWPPPHKLNGSLHVGLLHVDVKGGFSRFHDEKPFVINQKWVYDKYGIYVYKVIPKKWFAVTWVPAQARFSPKKGKLRDCYKNCETFETIKEQL